jgi:hypothetical protein
LILLKISFASSFIKDFLGILSWVNTVISCFCFGSLLCIVFGFQDFIAGQSLAPLVIINGRVLYISSNSSLDKKQILLIRSVSVILV